MATKAVEINELVPALAAERPVTWPKRTRAQAVERAAGGVGGGALDPQISWRIVFRAGNAVVVDRAHRWRK